MTLTIDLVSVHASLSSGDSNSGCHQTFVKVNSDWGIKFFTEEEHEEEAEEYRDIAYERQREAAACGCGPEVGDKIQIEDNYGYVTEIVELFNPRLSDNDFCAYFWGEEDRLINKNYTQNREYDELFLIEGFGNEVNDLCETLYECTGFMFTDTHGGNLGWKDGRLICIDFF